MTATTAVAAVAASTAAIVVIVLALAFWVDWLLADDPFLSDDEGRWGSL